MIGAGPAARRPLPTADGPVPTAPAGAGQEFETCVVGRGCGCHPPAGADGQQPKQRPGGPASLFGPSDSLHRGHSCNARARRWLPPPPWPWSGTTHPGSHRCRGVARARRAWRCCGRWAHVGHGCESLGRLDGSLEEHGLRRRVPGVHGSGAWRAAAPAGCKTVPRAIGGLRLPRLCPAEQCKCHLDDARHLFRGHNRPRFQDGSLRASWRGGQSGSCRGRCRSWH